MAKLVSMAVICVVMAAVLRFSAAQTAHVVGDSTGWTVPQGGASFYSNWASGKQFVVGDTLVFNFVTNSHDVVELSKESFDACTYSTTIGDIITTGPANITLTSAGDKYYICTIGRHCSAGQKLAITVSATPGAAPPTSSSAPPPPATSTTPSTPSPTSAACPPDTAPTPQPNTPSSTNPTNAAPPQDSGADSRISSSVFAGVFVSLVSLIMGFLL